MYIQLKLKQFKVKIKFGVSAAERETPQEVIIDLAIRFSRLLPGCKTDKIDDTLCYDKLTRRINEFCHEQPFHLIEYLGFQLFKFLKREFFAETDIKLQIKKQQPLDNLHQAIFEVGDFY